MMADRDKGLYDDAPQQPTTSDFLEILYQSDDISQFAQAHKSLFVDLSLGEYLESLMEAHGLKKAQVIKASGLSEAYTYQIFSGLKNPSRDKLLALAVGMRLSFDECQRLLKLAGVNELYVKNRRDAIIIFGLHKRLSLGKLNDILFDMEEFTL